ncbi:NADH-quinone oxidoreductase subunit N [Humisphaera borealis]|uniref:NADH-quinone oxidoreductase subunit N n=1 Tax=Humisphaera borealis TaxID=2807512 RepID=A0A7M2WUA6_9BACT|nr:NADH-quinone oxidoreductase subunit N [Humisphaera borealis]QOV89066.1 NADH-quinone oxidoreductase subunit N [Humisphaera borealis]
MDLLNALAPELVLIAVACVLFFLGTSHKPSMRRLSALIAFATLVAIFLWQGFSFFHGTASTLRDPFNVVHVTPMSIFVKTLVSGVGAVLVLLAWPGNRDATGSGSLNVGSDVGEYFGLALLAFAGVFLVSSTNDIILLFLAIELAAIPTYIMVSISRPLPVAQEAGVKYFFLGAMAAAVMLFGFSYVYGGTGHIRLDAISDVINQTRNGNAWAVPQINSFLLMGLIVLLAGFAFKIAAVPFHAYVGDVYQGAATPLTALLAFVPKISGFLAIIKILSAVGGAHYVLPPVVGTVLWVVAVLTMTFGNVLGLLQLNIKRVFAYSSIAHSGYMLVAVTALVMAAPQLAATDPAAATKVQLSALQGILFYIAAYGLMNGGAFGILMLLPTRAHKQMGDSEFPPVATTAETFEDLAGQGRKHPLLGLGMAICCFSLIGLPLTVGFFGKFYLIAPALKANLIGLVVITMINAAISAAYYLKIVSTMFIRPLPADEASSADASPRSLPLSLGVGLSVAATLVLGIALPWTDAFTGRIGTAAGIVAAPVAAPVVQTPPVLPAEASLR